MGLRGTNIEKNVLEGQIDKPARKNVLSPSSDTIMTESALTKLSRKLSVIAFVAASPV